MDHGYLNNLSDSMILCKRSFRNYLCDVALDAEEQLAGKQLSREVPGGPGGQAEHEPSTCLCRKGIQNSVLSE